MDSSSSFFLANSSNMMGVFFWCLWLPLLNPSSPFYFDIQGSFPFPFPLGLDGCAQGRQGNSFHLFNGFRRQISGYLLFFKCCIFLKAGLYHLLLLSLFLFFLFLSFLFFLYFIYIFFFFSFFLLLSFLFFSFLFLLFLFHSRGWDPTMFKGLSFKEGFSIHVSKSGLENMNYQLD